MPPRLDYLAELGRARAHALVLDKKRNAHIDPVMGCWLFQGSTNADGYGQVSVASPPR